MIGGERLDKARPRFAPPAFKTKGLRIDLEYTLPVEDRRMTIIRGVP